MAPQAPFGTQLEVLSVRLMRNAYRHPLLVALNFAATLAAAVGLALIFHNTGTDTGGIQNRRAHAGSGSGSGSGSVLCLAATCGLNCQGCRRTSQHIHHSRTNHTCSSSNGFSSC